MTKQQIVKKKSVKSVKQEEVSEDVDIDSSVISDIDENEELSDAFDYDKKKSENPEESGEYVQNVVAERVIKYIKLDDLIKEKQAEHKKEMKTIKDAKQQLEDFLITYLDKVDEEYIQVGNKSTLVKTEVSHKVPPKMEDISVCLVDGFRKYEIYDDDDEIKRVVKDFIKTIDEKREIKTRKYLKRTQGEADKNNKTNKVDKKDDNADKSNKTSTKQSKTKVQKK